jgi:GTP-binding protein
VINRELANYSPDLAERPQIVVATKIDALDEPERLESLKRQAKKDRKQFFAVSSAANTGIKELVFAVSDALGQITDLDPVDRVARTNSN